jgi:hypothetical protein
MSRTGSRPPRFRPSHRQPAPPQALRPPPAQSLLPLRADQHHPRRPQPGVLPQEARRGLQARPSRHRPRPTPHQRDVGPPARQPSLHPHPTHNADGLTQPDAKEPAACLRPVGVHRDTRAPEGSTCPPSWLTFLGWGTGHLRDKGPSTPTTLTRSLKLQPKAAS